MAPTLSLLSASRSRAPHDRLAAHGSKGQSRRLLEQMRSTDPTLLAELLQLRLLARMTGFQQPAEVYHG